MLTSAKAKESLKWLLQELIETNSKHREPAKTFLRRFLKAKDPTDQKDLFKEFALSLLEPDITPEIKSKLKESLSYFQSEKLEPKSDSNNEGAIVIAPETTEAKPQKFMLIEKREGKNVKIATSERSDNRLRCEEWTSHKSQQSNPTLTLEEVPSEFNQSLGKEDSCDRATESNRKMIKAIASLVKDNNELVKGKNELNEKIKELEAEKNSTCAKYEELVSKLKQGKRKSLLAMPIRMTILIILSVTISSGIDFFVDGIAVDHDQTTVTE